MAPLASLYFLGVLVCIRAAPQSCEAEDDLFSALQSSVRYPKGDLGSEQASQERGSTETCLPAEAGEKAPVAGMFSSNDGSILGLSMQKGERVDISGIFCVGAESMALLQRESGSSSVVDMERTLATKRGVKGEYPELQVCTDLEYGTYPAAKKPFCGQDDSYGCTKKSIVAKCGKIENACCLDADGSCSDGDDSVACRHVWKPPGYGELKFCTETGYETGARCAARGKYGCTKSKIEEFCGNMDNACCYDTDGSCTDGDDIVHCIKVRPAPYQELDMCLDNNTSPELCFGTNQYGCSEKRIKRWCGELSEACCSDPDGSCSDGDDRVKCKCKEPSDNNDRTFDENGCKKSR